MTAFRRTALASATAVFVCSLSFNAQAQDDAASSNVEAESVPALDYIAITGSYVDLDKDQYAKDATGINLHVGHQLGHGNWFIEGQLFTDVQETNLDNLTDFYRHGGGLDLVYSLNKRRTFSPYLLVGGGAEYYDVVPDSEDGWDFYANAGIGFVTQPLGLYGLRFRAEARYVYDNFIDGYSDIRYTAGLELPLSPYETPRPTVIAPPAAEPVTIVKTETLTESLADSDGDGVPDAGDKCPETPKGMPVDGVGCGLSQVITLTGVNFEFNKASLTPDSRKILEDVALKIKHFTSVPMELEGHTDNVGSDGYNLKLSQLRANSVRDFLVGQGVPGDKLTAVGLGESKPVADNATDAGRALNRRVELHIAGQQAAPSIPVDASGAPLDAAAPAAEAPAAEAPAADAAEPATMEDLQAQPAE